MAMPGAKMARFAICVFLILVIVAVFNLGPDPREYSLTSRSLMRSMLNTQDDTEAATTPSPGNSTTPSPGNSTIPSPGNSTIPSAGNSNSPSPGNSTSPSPGNSTNPSAGNSTSPSAGNSTSPSAGNSTSPSAGNSTNPSAGNSTSPPAENSPAPSVTSTISPTTPPTDGGGDSGPGTGDDDDSGSGSDDKEDDSTDGGGDSGPGTSDGDDSGSGSDDEEDDSTDGGGDLGPGTNDGDDSGSGSDDKESTTPSPSPKSDYPESSESSFSGFYLILFSSIGIVLFVIYYTRKSQNSRPRFQQLDANANVLEESFGDPQEDPEFSGDDSAILLLRSVLHDLGIPPFGMRQYEQKLKDFSLNRVEQLRGLDPSDWRRLDIPDVIEKELRAALRGDRSAKSGSMGAPSNGWNIKSGQRKSNTSDSKTKQSRRIGRPGASDVLDSSADIEMQTSAASNMKSNSRSTKRIAQALEDEPIDDTKGWAEFDDFS